MKRKQLLIIHKTQFGYLTDVYKWCQYLKNEYDITVVSLNQSNPVVEMDGVKVIDVTGKKYVYRGIKFLIYCIWELLKNRGVSIVSYFNEASFLRTIFFYKKMILDVRTLSVASDENERKKVDSKIVSLVPKYTYVTVISEGVKRLLGKCAKDIFIIPLGAELRTADEHKKQSPSLLYVGTLVNRRIEDTIYGLKLFVDKNPAVDIVYDIVGDGKNGELDVLKDLVRDLNLEKIVKFHGRLPNTKIGMFLDKANIGVSYIPITDYYEYQPPTKTFEYILSGSLCLATATFANKELITDKNGCLIEDNSSSFAEGLEYCCRKLENYNPKEIRQSLIDYTWENIVNNKLKIVLDKF